MSRKTALSSAPWLTGALCGRRPCPAGLGLHHDRALQRHYVHDLERLRAESDLMYSTGTASTSLSHRNNVGRGACRTGTGACPRIRCWRSRGLVAIAYWSHFKGFCVVTFQGILLMVTFSVSGSKTIKEPSHTKCPGLNTFVPAYNTSKEGAVPSLRHSVLGKG